jgi:hypothetical protein
LVYIKLFLSPDKYFSISDNCFPQADMAFQKKLLRLQTVTYNKATHLQVKRQQNYTKKRRNGHTSSVGWPYDPFCPGQSRFTAVVPMSPRMLSGRKYILFLIYKKYGINKHLRLLAKFQFPVFSVNELPRCNIISSPKC